MGTELIEPGVALSEHFRGQAPVLGRVESAPGFSDDRVEPVKQREGLVTAVREIQREVVPFRGKDSIPGEAREPKVLRTTRNEPSPARAMASSIAAVASFATSGGTTLWYWYMPRCPYIRFQPPMRSRG